MPAVAIVGAVAAVGMAASTGFAVVATIAAVGATVAAVGAVTKSKELMIAGGVLGAVGAIGGLASSAGMFGAGGIDGLFGAAAGAGEGAAASAAGLAGDVSFVAPAAGETMAGIMQSSNMPGVYAGMEAVNAGSGFAPVFDAGQYGSIGDVIDMMNGVNVTPNVAPNVVPDVATSAGSAEVINQYTGQPLAQGSDNPMMGPDGVDPMSTVPSARNDPLADPNAGVRGGEPATTSTFENPLAPAPPAQTVTGAPAPSAASGPGASATGTPAGQTPAPATPWEAGVAIPPSSNAAAVAAAAGKAVPAAGDPSVWSKIFDTLGKPGIGTLGYGVLQAGASFLSGATSELTPAQVKQLEAQAAQNQAAANLYNQQAGMLADQRANMAAPLPVANRPSGLMNTPPRLAPVTGRVAA